MACPLSLPHPAVRLLWVTRGWEDTRKASGVTAAPVAWLPSVPLALEEKFLPETQRPVFEGVLQEGAERGDGGGGGTERWVLWGLLRSSPARVGSRLASRRPRGPCIFVFQAALQGELAQCLAFTAGGGAGLGRVPRPGSPWWGTGTSPCSLFIPTHGGTPERNTSLSLKS